MPLIPAKVLTAAAPTISAALLSLVGEGRALFIKEFRTFSGPLRISVAIKVERKGSPELQWKEPTQH